MLTPPAGRAWPLLSYLYGGMVVLGLGYALLGIPIQVTDGFTNMVTLPGQSLLDTTVARFFDSAYLRPLLWAHLHVLYALADGRYSEWFRGWHVFQVLVLVLLFVGLLRPRTRIDAAVVPLGLAVMVGIHTFAGTVREAFPVNTFMTVLLCCLGAALTGMGAPRWWRDLLAVVLFVFAALTVESGLLVWVVCAAAYLAGARGVSRGAIVAMTVLFGAYFVLRFWVLDVGSPGLIERNSGYGFSALEPHELVERFGSNPLPFYAYNVVVSSLSVLWSEPRGGVWHFVDAVMRGEIAPFMLVNVTASLLGTGLIAHFVWSRRAAWRAWRFEPGDRLVFVFLAVLAANSVISYPYTKDVVMSPAGVFYALAVAVAARDLLARPAVRRGSVIVSLLLLSLLSTTWMVRAVGAHIGLRRAAVTVRNEWAYVDRRLDAEWRRAAGPAAAALADQLQHDALTRRPGLPMLTGDWLDWFEYE